MSGSELGDSEALAAADDLTIDGCPFDHHSAAYRDHGVEIMSAYRSDCPVPFTTEHGGYFVATRYEDIAAIARDDKRFSSDWRNGSRFGGTAIPPTHHRFGFIMMDPPHSLAFRRSFMPFFTAGAAERLAPDIRRYAEESLDEVAGATEFDVVRQFCDRIPAMTTTHMLGLDVENWPRYVAFFHHSLSDDQTDPGYREMYGADNWVLADLHSAVTDRRTNPRDDGITWALGREVGGRAMTDDEVVESLMLIMIGGFDTSSALLANAIRYLADQPELRRALIADDNLLRSATEEFLRFFSPVQNLARTVTEDCQVSGRDLKLGDRILLCWASANRDEAAFPDPHVMKVDRFPNRHQAFGLGTHRCAGSHIARVEFVEAIGAFLRRYDDYSIELSRSQRYKSIGSNNGWLSMIVQAPSPTEQGLPVRKRS